MKNPPLLSILTSPRRFFRAANAHPASLGLPFLVVLGFVSTRVTGNYLIFKKMALQIPESLAGGIEWMTFGFGVMLVATALADFVFWFMATGILACTNILLDGDGEYRKLLELTGYSYLPLFAFSLAVLVFGILYSPSIDFGSYEDLDLASLEQTDRERYDQAVKGIESILLSEVKKPAFVAFASASICAYVWLGALVLMANATTFRLTLTKSAISVGAVIALHVVIEISRRQLFPGSI